MSKQITKKKIVFQDQKQEIVLNQKLLKIHLKLLLIKKILTKIKQKKKIKLNPKKNLLILIETLKKKKPQKQKKK